MKPLLVLAVLGCSLATIGAEEPCPEPPGSTHGEMGKLQGTWKVVSLKVGGTDIGALPGNLNLSLVFDKGKVTAKGQGNNKPGTFKLGASNKFKHIDLTTDNKTTEGIYKLEKDKLTICMPPKPEGKHPKGFDDPSAAVMVLKKEKK